MNKQEFLGASLHTGLYVGQHRCGKIEPYPLYGMKHVRNVDKISCYIDDKEHGDYQNSWIDGVTPILRPLSAITKPITHNGETFVPIDMFTPSDAVDIKMASTNCELIKFLSFYIIEQLIEWHFNLMDKSEPFIPVTSEFNPYK